MAFKHKELKKQSQHNQVTIETKHNFIIKEIEEENNKVNEKKKELEKLKLIINKTQHDKDMIFELENYIKNYNETNYEKSYYLENAHLLFKYYDIKNNSKKTNNIKNANDKSIMNYFINIEDKKESPISEKTSICDTYLKNIDPNYVTMKNINSDICKLCKVEKITYISDGVQICPKCGDETEILIESIKPSYKDPPREVTYFSYKRINHFNEWLAQFQAKETTDIPQDVYNEILEEISKERIILSQIDNKKLREILKKLKKNKYYEHIPHILNKLNGITPPTMTIEMEEELRRMFREIQIPFIKYCPKNRKNFLSYSYVLHKFVELLELDDFINCFILLKSREKIHQQDQIWKKICEHLKWQFIPSI
jgi:hypothetical protein